MQEPQVFRTDIKVSARYYDYNNGEPTTLYRGSYLDGTPALLVDDYDEDIDDIDQQTLSVNLAAYKMFPAPGNVFLADFSEHEGLTKNLVKAGVVEIVRPVRIGMGSGYEVKLLDA